MKFEHKQIEEMLEKGSLNTPKGRVFPFAFFNPQSGKKDEAMYTLIFASPQIVAQLLEEVKWLGHIIDHFKYENAKIQTLTEALSFYADTHSWQGMIHRKAGEWEGYDGTLIANDSGAKAREALEKAKR